MANSKTSPIAQSDKIRAIFQAHRKDVIALLDSMEAMQKELDDAGARYILLDVLSNSFPSHKWKKKRLEVESLQHLLSPRNISARAERFSIDYDITENALFTLAQLLEGGRA